MDTIGKRFKYFLQKENVSVAEASDLTGIPVPSFYRIFNSDSGLNSTTLTALLENFPSLNVNWLLTGNGLHKNSTISQEVSEERASYGNDDNLKSRVKEILNNEVVLDAFVEILKKYGK